MASYNGNIDLLSLSGAQIYTGIDLKSPQRAFVCIPIDLNDIRLSSSRNTPDRTYANLRVNIWPFNEQYKAKIRQSAQERGDTDVNVPTHEMQMSYGVDYIKGIIEKFPKLAEEVKDANKQRYPEIVGQNPIDETTHLFKLIRQRLNKRIAVLYQPKSVQHPSAYTQPNFAQAGGATAYVAPAEPADPLQGIGAGFDDDDLPF